MERVDLRQIEYFVAVAEELHFGRAAERLYIAQPSLSKQIRRLEAQLGVQLLYRTSRRVELTPAGTALLREGRRAIGQAQRALSAAREQAGELLTVGFYGSAGSALLPQVLAAYRASQPHVHVVLKELGLSHVDQIASGEVHVAFTRLRPGEANLEIEIINDEPRVVALPVDHGLASCDSIAFADLRNEAFASVSAARNPAWHDSFQAERARHALTGDIVAEVSSIEEILTLVAAGRAVCVVPAATARLYPRARVAYVTVRDAEPAVVSLARPHGQPSPSLEAFIAVTRAATETPPHAASLSTR